MPGRGPARGLPLWLALVLAALLLPGCAEPPETPQPSRIEVSAYPQRLDPTQSPPGKLPSDGERVAQGHCGPRVDYLAHVHRDLGTLEVNVTDPDGRETRFTYTADASPDTHTLEGPAGTWTLHARYTAFHGGLHVQLTCPSGQRL